MTNPWVFEEQEFIEKEIRQCKRKRNEKMENRRMYKFLILLGFIAILSYANAEEFSCPYCDKPIEVKRTWGDTWTCPNPDCRYENYVGLDYCGICGQLRFQKK